MGSGPQQLSKFTGGGLLSHVRYAFSYVSSYSRTWPPYTLHVLYMVSFLSISIFFHLRVFAYFLVGSIPFSYVGRVGKCK
jgi:hypothetical protein